MTVTAAFSHPPLKVYIIAGEASGDLLGAHLMRELKAQSTRELQFFGVGGPRMAQEGLNSLFPYYELSMLGFVEILPYVFNLSARITRTVDDIQAKDPAIVITIDVPGFSFRVVKELRDLKFNRIFVHYVAPTVWAYKPERAARCAELFDHMLVLLPFEPPYFQKVGLDCTWVGHPVVAETSIGDGAAFRRKYELSADTPLFCLLPGSRKGEVERHMPIFAKTIGMLAMHYPNLAIAVMVPANVMPYVAPFFEDCPFRAIVTSDEEEKKDAIAASNLAIVKSGTIAIEVAMAQVPMVVTYRVHPLSAWLMKRIALIKYVNLINILQKKGVIPELLQELCTPFMLANACLSLVAHPERQQKQKNHEKAALDKLLLPDGQKPSAKAASTILKLLHP